MQLTILPVRRIVLYKHGVGFVERKGYVSGNSEIRLGFKKDVMNDILKSLCVTTSGEGKVTAVSYETPDDISQLIEEKAIRVPEKDALVGLFRHLKGYRVQIKTASDTVTGKVMGTQEYENKKAALLVHKVVIMDDVEQKIRSFDIHNILYYTILDAEAMQDLNFFLEAVTSERKKNFKGVTVYVDGADTEVKISYINPMPSWRVSYRVALETSKRSTAFLQGWGIIDNVLDEDLQDVEVSLVAGKPVSFIYDLYTPPVVKRAVVKEENRNMAGPIEFQAQAKKMARTRAYTTEACREEAMDFQPMAMMAAAPPMPRMAAMMASSTAVDTRSVEMGEFFRYDVQSPITVKRGQSAMVPIIQVDVPCKKEHVFNASKDPRNPAVVVRLTTENGVVLERGPVVILEDGNYVGEAIVPYTLTDNECLVAYAVDMGVNVSTENGPFSRRWQSMGIEGEYIVTTEVTTTTTKYSVENRTKDAVNLVIEHPRNPSATSVTVEGGVLEDGIVDHHHRIRTKVEGHTSLLVTVVVEQLDYQRESVNYADPAVIMNRCALNSVSPVVTDNLKAVFAARAEVSKLEQDEQELRAQLNSLMEDQKRIRENMGALGNSDEERSLRSRYVAQLQAQEGQHSELSAQLKRVAKDLRTARDDYGKMLTQRVEASA